METTIYKGNSSETLGKVTKNLKNQALRVDSYDNGQTLKFEYYDVCTDTGVKLRLRSASYAILCGYETLRYFENTSMLSKKSVLPAPTSDIKLIPKSSVHLFWYITEGVIQKKYKDIHLGADTIREWYMSSLECECTPKALHSEFHDDLTFSMYFEYAGHSLWTVLEEEKKSPPEDQDILNNATDVIRQLITCFHKLSTYGIIHADIKPANIVVSYDYFGSVSIPKVKVIDFGLSSVDTSPGCMLKKYSSVQTSTYRAPEFGDLEKLLNGKYYPKFLTFNNSIDIYSLGWTCIDILNSNYTHTTRNIARGMLNDLEATEAYFSNLETILLDNLKYGGLNDAQKDILKRSVSVDRKDRPSYEELEEVFNAEDIEEKCLADKIPPMEENKYASQSVFYLFSYFDNHKFSSNNPECLSILIDTIDLVRRYPFDDADFDYTGLWPAIFLYVIASIHHYDHVLTDSMGILLSNVMETIDDYSDRRIVDSYFMNIFSLRSNIKRFDTPIVYLDRSLAEEQKNDISRNELQGHYNNLLYYYRSKYVNGETSADIDIILNPSSQQEFYSVYIKVLKGAEQHSEPSEPLET